MENRVSTRVFSLSQSYVQLYTHYPWWIDATLRQPQFEKMKSMVIIQFYEIGSISRMIHKRMWVYAYFLHKKVENQLIYQPYIWCSQTSHEKYKYFTSFCEHIILFSSSQLIWLRLDKRTLNKTLNIIYPPLSPPS